MGDRVCVRFAYSPTGMLRIGNTRTTRLNWLFAHASDGTSVLWVKDTDVARRVEGARNSACLESGALWPT